MTGTLTDLQRTAAADKPTIVTAPPSRWKTRLLLPGVILTIIIVLLLITSAQALLPATPVRVVPVVAKTVEGSSGTVTVHAPGWLEPDPHPFFVAALADGIVEEMLVLEGDRVEPDQVVARLVDDDAKLALKRAEAIQQQRESELLAAQAESEAAKLEFEHLIERTRSVATSEAAVAEAIAQIQQAHADIAVAQAEYNEVQDEYDRKSQLSSEAVPAAFVARLRLRLEALQATVDAAKAGVAVLEAKRTKAEVDRRAAVTRMDLLIQERRAVALTDAAVETARAFVALAEAARDEAKLRLTRMEVTSPVAGIVMTRLASPGSKVTLAGDERSSHVVYIYDPARLQVRVDIPLADAGHVSVGQAVEVIVEVLPDRTFLGEVTRVVPEADIQKNTVEVKVAIRNPSNELKPEMLARARFIAREQSIDGSSRQRVFVPASLVRDTESGQSAMIVTNLIDDLGRVELRSIVTGARRIDDWIEIESGLQIGDMLIADPATGLEPGDRVRVLGEQTPSGD